MHDESTGNHDNRLSANHRVLIVDDDPAQCRLMKHQLESHGYIARSTVSAEDALGMIRESPPDFLLTDWEMPGVDGLELTRRLRAMSHDAHVFVIFLTVRRQQQDLVTAIEAGADDFLTKPVRIAELLARMTAGGRVLRREARLARLAWADSLTDLPSRRTFEVVLEREWHRAFRYRRPLSCLMFDIDYFKQVNDTYGHPVGDDVLRVFSSLLTESARDDDHVCRYGGEEFCVLLPETCEAEAASWADNFRRRLRHTNMSTDDGGVYVTTSCGIAEVAGAMDSPADLVKSADECLLRAKEMGRDQVVSHRKLQQTLPAAMASGEVRDALQGLSARDAMTPIVHSLRPDCPVHSVAEYLLRFRISGAPVTSESGELLGIVSNRDVLNVGTANIHAPLVASDIVQRNVITYDEETPLQQVLDFMRRVPVQTIVVTSAGKPTGILSVVSLLRWYLERVQSVCAGEVARERSSSLKDAPPCAVEAQVAPRAEFLVEQANALRHVLLSARQNDDDRVAELVSRATSMQEIIEELLASEARPAWQEAVFPY